MNQTSLIISTAIILLSEITTLFLVVKKAPNYIYLLAIYVFLIFFREPKITVLEEIFNAIIFSRDKTLVANKKKQHPPL